MNQIFSKKKKKKFITIKNMQVVTPNLIKKTCLNFSVVTSSPNSILMREFVCMFMVLNVLHISFSSQSNVGLDFIVLSISFEISLSVWVAETIQHAAFLGKLRKSSNLPLHSMHSHPMGNPFMQEITCVASLRSLTLSGLELLSS